MQDIVPLPGLLMDAGPGVSRLVRQGCLSCILPALQHTSIPPSRSRMTDSSSLGLRYAAYQRVLTASRVKTAKIRNTTKQEQAQASDV